MSAPLITMHGRVRRCSLPKAGSGSAKTTCAAAQLVTHGCGSSGPPSRILAAVLKVFTGPAPATLLDGEQSFRRPRVIRP